MAQPQAPQAPKGLSSVPKLAVDLDSAGTAEPGRAVVEGRGRGFAGTELVSAAAALFHKQPVWNGAEGRGFLLTVSAGTVGVSHIDQARRERNALNALGHETRGTRQVVGPERHRRKSPEGIPAGVVYDPYTTLAIPPYPGRLVFDDDDEWTLREPQPSRQVAGWSRKSRARMVRRLAQLDWTPLYASGRAGALLTFTYPGDWLTVAPSGKAAKKHLDKFRKRWERKWGSPLVCAWKLEFQDRGAPHFHLLTVPPQDPTFREWLSAAWAGVVAHPDEDERRKHLAAGTGVDYLKGGRIIDPKRAAVYFSKHGGAAGGKEYQHRVPEAWQESGQGPGRFWGYWGLTPVTADAPVYAREYVQLRRTLRRWSQAQGLRRTVRVPRGPGFDPVTGERVELAREDESPGLVGRKRRKVTRRARYLGAGGLQGGTLLVNDGPAFASALARHPALSCSEP